MCGKNNGQMDFRSGFELSYILLCCTIGKDSFLSKKKKSYLQIVEINSLVSNGWIFFQFSMKKLFKILMAGVYVLTMSRSS